MLGTPRFPTPSHTRAVQGPGAGASLAGGQLAPHSWDSSGCCGLTQWAVAAVPSVLLRGAGGALPWHGVTGLVAHGEHPQVSPDLTLPGQQWRAGGQLPAAPQSRLRAWFLSLPDGRQLC